MLPRLHAEEQLAAIHAAAVGGGHLPGQDAKAAIGRLERRAAGASRHAPANPAVLTAMGIAVVEAGKAQEAADG